MKTTTTQSFNVEDSVLHNLLTLAESARENAYARYSGFRVGAAVVSSEGAVYTGCNVENASLGLTVCAERVAIFNAISQGARTIQAVAVSCKDDANCVPCGACLQVISEFASADVPILLGSGKSPRIVTLNDCLPSRFSLSARRRGGASRR